MNGLFQRMASIIIRRLNSTTCQPDFLNVLASIRHHIHVVSQNFITKLGSLIRSICYEHLINVAPRPAHSRLEALVPA